MTEIRRSLEDRLNLHYSSDDVIAILKIGNPSRQMSEFCEDYLALVLEVRELTVQLTEAKVKGLQDQIALLDRIKP